MADRQGSIAYTTLLCNGNNIPRIPVNLPNNKDTLYIPLSQSQSHYPFCSSNPVEQQSLLPRLTYLPAITTTTPTSPQPPPPIQPTTKTNNDLNPPPHSPPTRRLRRNPLTPHRGRNRPLPHHSHARDHTHADRKMATLPDSTEAIPTMADDPSSRLRRRNLGCAAPPAPGDARTE